MQKLRKLNTDLGSPGVEALWKAARKAALDVSKVDVKEVVCSSVKQVLLGYNQVMGRLSAVHLLIVG